MKIAKNILFTITALIASQYVRSQCDENVWNESWTSCELSTSPNPQRGESHWLLYEFDSAQPITDMHIWNANREGESNLGAKDVSIDYSTNGSSWVELGDYTFARADESPRLRRFRRTLAGGNVRDQDPVHLQFELRQCEPQVRLDSRGGLQEGRRQRTGGIRPRAHQET